MSLFMERNDADQLVDVEEAARVRLQHSPYRRIAPGDMRVHRRHTLLDRVEWQPTTTSSWHKLRSWESTESNES